MSAFAGVPLNAAVAGSKTSHAGSGEPSASVAASVTAPPSGSVNVPSGSRYAKGTSSSAERSGRTPLSCGGLSNSCTNGIEVPSAHWTCPNIARWVGFAGSKPGSRIASPSEP